MGILISKFTRLSINNDKIETETKNNETFLTDEQHLKTPKEKFFADQMLDPRSATVGIRRTPLVLVKVSSDTPVKPKMYIETDLDDTYRNDNSFASELEESYIAENSLSIQGCVELSTNDDVPDNEVDTTKVSENGIDVEDSYPEEINSYILKDVDVDTPSKYKPKKTFIFEDDNMTPESTPIKPKGGRTPLTIVSTNNSPMPSPLGKPWRGIREERLRLGLENTPPANHREPFLDVVQSAPGKVGIKRTGKKAWAKAHWAIDESVVI